MPIHYAAALGQTNVINELLAAGCPVDARACSNDTPLHVAIMHGQIESIKLLLENNADAHLAGQYGSTVLHCACSLSKRAGDWSNEADVAKACQIVRILTEKHNANLNTRDANGRTPLQYARDATLVQTLLAAGADPLVTDTHGRTLLHDAVTCSNAKDKIQILLDAGIDVNARDLDGRNALFNAHYRHVHTLTRSGADVNARDNTGNTPLIYTILAPRGSGLSASELLACGADVDATDAEGKTALHHAMVKALPGAIEMLLRSGADHNLRTHENYTPLQIGLLVEIQQNMLDHDLHEAHQRYNDCHHMLLQSGAAMKDE